MKSLITPFIFIIVVSVLVVGASVYSQEEYVEANVLDVQGITIVLGRDCKAIIADTTEERATSILLGMNKEIFLRPTAYDNFADILKTYEIGIDRVSFDYFDGSFYYASIVLNNGEKIVSIDSKPSDAISLGLRMDAPIYVNKTLLSEIGMDIC